MISTYPSTGVKIYIRKGTKSPYLSFCGDALKDRSLCSGDERMWVRAQQAALPGGANNQVEKPQEFPVCLEAILNSFSRLHLVSKNLLTYCYITYCNNSS